MKMKMQRARLSSRVALIFLIWCLTICSRGEGSRILKVRVMESLLLNRLPRGPVPPSGPSPCHNKYEPLDENKFYNYPGSQIVCP